MNFLSLAGSGSGVLKNTSLPVWHQRVGINFKVAASVTRASGELITKLTIKEKEMHHHHHHHQQPTASKISSQFLHTFRSLFDPWLRNLSSPLYQCHLCESIPAPVVRPWVSQRYCGTVWEPLGSRERWNDHSAASPACERWDGLPQKRVFVGGKTMVFTIKYKGNPVKNESHTKKPTRIKKEYDIEKSPEDEWKHWKIRSDFDFKFQDLGFWFRV